MMQLNSKQLAGLALGGLALIGGIVALSSGGSGAAAVAAGGAGAVDAVLAAWKSGGHAVASFAPVDGARPGGGDCRQGAVDGIETVLCTYASEAAAQAARAAGLAHIGDVTGAALSNGSTLLVVADRKGQDPSGRTLNRLTQAFRKP